MRMQEFGVWCSTDGMTKLSIDTVRQFEIDTVRLMDTENFSEFQFGSNKWNNNGFEPNIVIIIEVQKSAYHFHCIGCLIIGCD